MAELGDHGPAAHAAVAGHAADLGVEVLAAGTDLYGVDGLKDTAAAITVLGERALGQGDAVLVKGSRVAGLEAVVEGLVGG
jgi:UDP-N-acetylmuramoyl-tripeptide--D-alanyl-D-alanine ligase